MKEGTKRKEEKSKQKHNITKKKVKNPKNFYYPVMEDKIYCTWPTKVYLFRELISLGPSEFGNESSICSILRKQQEKT